MKSFHSILRGVLAITGVLVLSCTSNKNVDLAAPAEGLGFHFETGDIVVPSGTEEQDCYFFQVPGEETDSVYIKRIEVAQNEGSHHMNIFRVRTIVGLDPANGAVQTATNGVGECFKAPNWADWPLLINSQTDSHVDWSYPDGVANQLQGGDWLMLQTHYVNAATQQTPFQGHVEVNFWTTPLADVTYEMGTLFATNQLIRVCEHGPSPTTFGRSCGFNSSEPIHIIGANGHFHSRGKVFDILFMEGSTVPPAENRFYRSEDWDHPPMDHSPDLDQVVPAGGGIYYTCEFEWKEPPPEVGCEGLNAFDKTVYHTPDDELDCCYTFGGIVDKAEHCNAFVYYYPKVDNVTCQ